MGFSCVSENSAVYWHGYGGQKPCREAWSITKALQTEFLGIAEIKTNYNQYFIR